jgi:hypothetical protein
MVLKEIGMQKLSAMVIFSVASHHYSNDPQFWTLLDSLNKLKIYAQHIA